ncbi:MAG: isocitrate lyase/PEP mutase family protein, partial [Clostridia bacterium]|nr:isocitrate lyase/PEP mutase family protein [Clostridia bacterium]
MKIRKQFRELAEAKEILVLPGAYDALSAKIVEAAGFKGVYLTGYGQSASKLGKPDVGLMSMAEMAERARDMTMAVNIPVACDADTGFGNSVNVIRTVQE